MNLIVSVLIAFVRETKSWMHLLLNLAAFPLFIHKNLPAEARNADSMSSLRAAIWTKESEIIVDLSTIKIFTYSRQM